MIVSKGGPWKQQRNYFQHPTFQYSMDQGFVQRFSSRVAFALLLGALIQNHSTRPEPAGCHYQKSITMGRREASRNDEVLKDRDFYEESGGGLTCLAGEIFAQFEFAKATLKRLREKGIIPLSKQLPVEHENSWISSSTLILFIPTWLL